MYLVQNYEAIADLKRKYGLLHLTHNELEAFAGSLREASPEKEDLTITYLENDNDVELLIVSNSMEEARSINKIDRILGLELKKVRIKTVKAKPIFWPGIIG